MLLRQLGKRLEQGGNYYEVKFPAVPGAKRVRKRKGETDEQVAARRAQMKAA